jgi:cell division septum initiation protein DivIVA
MDIVNIIDRLEALITTSLKLPVAQRTLLDGKKVQELVDQLRLAVPQDVKAAEQILLRKDEILNQSESDRRRIKAEAEEEFRSRINQTEILKDAERKSAELLQEAERKAARMISQSDVEARTKKAEADAYSAKTLRTLERQLTSNLTSIRNGLAVLTGVDSFEVVATGKKE